MREVQVSPLVRAKLAELELFLIHEFKLSEEAAVGRVDRMQQFLYKLANPGDYALCRFKRWKMYGWRCVPFERNWVFAYRIVGDEVRVEDMSHVAMLTEVN